EFDGASGPVPAQGDFAVTGDRILFAPRLPQIESLADAGLRAGEAYRITVPGTGASVTIRSHDGRAPETDFRTTFETRSAEPLFEDLSSAPLHAIGALVDLDGDGVLEGDGLASTVEPE